MDETELVNGFNSENNLCHVESCDVLREDLVLDKHSHQITTRQELHEHVKEGVVLECGVQLNNPRTVRLGEDVTFGAYVGELVFLELRSVRLSSAKLARLILVRTISCLTSDLSA
jgi:hypothetical protein